MNRAIPLVYLGPVMANGVLSWQLSFGIPSTGHKEVIELNRPPAHIPILPQRNPVRKTSVVWKHRLRQGRLTSLDPVYLRVMKRVDLLHQEKWHIVTLILLSDVFTVTARHCGGLSTRYHMNYFSVTSSKEKIPLHLPKREVQECRLQRLRITVAQRVASSIIMKPALTFHSLWKSLKEQVKNGSE